MTIALILAICGAGFSCLLALFVAIRERSSQAHWAFVAGMVGLGIESVLCGLNAAAIVPGETVYWQHWRLLAVAFLPSFWLPFSLSYARGNYRECLARWRRVLFAFALLPVGLVVGGWRSLIVSIKPTAAGDTWVLGLGTVGWLVNILWLVSAILVLMNLERTFRASVGTMRWRIKYMVLGVGLLFAVRVYTSTQVLIFRAVDLSLQTVNSVALLVACLLILRSLIRAGHFQVTVYPSQFVLRHSLTALLAGVYLVIVGLLAKVAVLFGGDASFTLKAFGALIALVTLTMLLVSDRVRLGTKRFVSRHFRRPLYDYRAVWRTFTEGTAARVQQQDLCRAVVNLVADIFQVLSVTIWLVDDQQEKLTFAAATSLSEARAVALKPQGELAVETIRHLQEHHEPIDIESAKEDWVRPLRQCHPDEFHKGGGRVCVPLMAGGEILGLITLGDRVSGVPFSPEDYDLLKCIGDQVGANLKNVQLSRRLLQAKELEAFQAMSAFFVHDLKNTASTLNLMFQNLPVHFNDAAFREDALRGISKTVAHLNHLIERLTLLRHELKIQPVESDLNEVVARTLAGWEKAAGVSLVKELRPLPKVSLDGEQIGKVVTNLVLNAAEAVASGGQVRIETSQANGQVILAVADTGCGMTADFLSRSLFRPFQTTKKNGLGIGMFQSKMIVEAHGGKIEVTSELGRGTTFRVFLPVHLKQYPL